MKRFLATLALSLGFSYSPAFAQALDGTWSGVTPGGFPLQVTISGNQTTSYIFQNRPQGISGGKVTGNKVAFNVYGPGQPRVSMTKGKGNTASFSYMDDGRKAPMVITVTKQ